MRKCDWCPTFYDSRDALHLCCSTRCRVAKWRRKKRNQDPATLRARRVTAAGDRSRNAVDRSKVAALYVRHDGHYPKLDDVDAWDVKRDASTYQGPFAAVAHPPCGPWGAFRHSCTTQRADLAVRAIDQVRRFGGVLEHPANSHLWIACELPPPGGTRDRWGGWTLFVRQSWWGHKAPKRTYLYIVGRTDVPELPPPVPDPPGRVERMSRRQREMTPPAFAAWLVALARGCQPGTFRKAGYAAMKCCTACGAAGVKFLRVPDLLGGKINVCPACAKGGKPTGNGSGSNQLRLRSMEPERGADPTDTNAPAV